MLLAVSACVVGWASSHAAEASELNYFDWMGPAPLVIHGEIVSTVGRYVEVRVDGVYRGALQEGDLVHVRQKVANRERDDSDDALKMLIGDSYFLLLEPAPRRKNRDPDALYDLVRDVDGARELPAEGAPALLDAVRQLARLQNMSDEVATWVGMERFLEDTNPLLVLAAIDHHLKFRRGDFGHLGSLRPLLRHPRADLREQAATLIAQILERHSDQALEEAGLLHGELAARARRDVAVPVRVAATRAVDRLWNPGAQELLEEIAGADPDQLVRYTAQRLLWERSLADRPEPPDALGR